MEKIPSAAPPAVSRHPAGPISAEEQYVTFTVGSEEYGVNILSVREIRGWTIETKLPNMPDYVRGVVNLRGIIIPIFDLRARFGGGRTEVTKRHVVVVLQVGERTRGVLVDAISDILTVAHDAVRPPPDIDGGLIEQQYLSGLVIAENRMVTLLDVTRLFAGDAVEELSSNHIQIPHQALA
ncbi:chemotaxis protein CheW [Skermanella stibiiresistens SB22]|uniref:Chemotaxis protein CheW n=1 Tax=Skermanella stibiiresistens SB22 TaxID=1385369 RepID=W9H4W0_9PROT|nr:chemotaxis protein CheW [Skermanella stibiiresistens]EWY39826.1 chemotaxis protein CheW [Skermanella stibiiresistens SB22]